MVVAVMDGQGNPVEEARVTFSNRTGAALVAKTSVSGEATLISRGRVSGTPRAEHNGQLAVGTTRTIIPGTAQRIQLQFPDEMPIEILVTDTDNSPIAGASVRAFEGLQGDLTPATAGQTFMRTGVTGDDGRITLPAIPSGFLTITATASRYFALPTHHRPHRIKPELITIRMVPARTLRLRTISTMSGKPIPLVPIRINVDKRSTHSKYPWMKGTPTNLGLHVSNEEGEIVVAFPHEIGGSCFVSDSSRWSGQARIAPDQEELDLAVHGEGSTKVVLKGLPRDMQPPQFVAAEYGVPGRISPRITQVERQLGGHYEVEGARAPHGPYQAVEKL